jgi:chemotaxis protein CheX
MSIILQFPYRRASGEVEPHKRILISPQAAAKMADEGADMIADLDELVTSSVTELFSTMLNMNMLPAPMQAGFGNGEPHVAGTVGFIGWLSGVVYVFTTVSFARRITATFLGLHEAEIEGDEMINDAMGEMANMLVGQMKSRLSDRGMPCMLTIPSVVRGSNFSVEATTSTEGHIFSFVSGENRIFIQVLLKPSDASQN